MILPSQKPLGIIAGGGQLPNLIIDACRAQGLSYFIIALEGFAETGSFNDSPVAWVNLGNAAKGFERLHSVGVQEVVMAGLVRRPSFIDLRPDWRTGKFLARIGIRAFLDLNSVGDDRLLRAIITEFEQEGFKVIAVDAVLSDALVAEGSLGAFSPSKNDQADIQIGFNAAKKLGGDDIGQAVVVQNGKVLAEESIDGTDELINRAGAAKDKGPGPLLVKVSKPGQDRRADLPVIGPQTVTACAQAGLRGIVIEAGGTLVIEKREIARLADETCIFVTAVVSGCNNQ